MAYVFVSAGGVGGINGIAARHAGTRRNRNSIERLNEGIGGPKRVGKVIETQKTVAGWD